ncbi:beta-ketoacyl-ACP synthase III [Iodidimonas sp. SYSU 1G8]|uniref:beta-ketoacyl-ACP synthase III n=1 Tax=Iodidimonas sp. SYSU 1G8 TaxID=3133967 RepID=UPI0031FE777A
MSGTRTVVKGVGAYLPARIVTNAEMAKIVDTTDDWIVERTGIMQRHIAAEGEYTSDLATAAGRAALENAGMDASSIDMVLVATATPDETFPATAVTVQAKLGITGGAAFDLQAVCSGFVYGFAVADNLIRGGLAKNILLIGAETFSRILDWEDRTTCVLFGDGAGAVVLSGETDAGDRGIIANKLRSDGTKHDLLYVDGGPSTTQTVGKLRMRGKDVFKHAVTNLADIVEAVLQDTGLSPSDIDWIVPHQANRRILDATAKKLGVDPDRVVVTVHDHGNTSAASVPLALERAVRDGRIKRGDLVLLEAMGGGFTWGASLVRW